MKEGCFKLFFTNMRQALTFKMSKQLALDTRHKHFGANISVIEESSELIVIPGTPSENLLSDNEESD